MDGLLSAYKYIGYVWTRTTLNLWTKAIGVSGTQAGRIWDVQEI